MECLLMLCLLLQVDPEEYKEAMAQLRGGDQPQQQQPQQQRIRDR